jgi:ligand-binding SRPBCC domain-containing protein
MKTYELEVEQQFQLGIEETFGFFENPANLAQITPPWLRFEIKTRNVAMQEGAEIDYTIRWMGLPLSWRTLIEEYDPPVRFVDVQAKGPYALWHHTHTFQPNENGTLVTDSIGKPPPLAVRLARAHGAQSIVRNLRLPAADAD